VSRGEGKLLTAPKPRAVSLLSVCLTVKPVGEPDALIGHVRSGDGKRSVAEWPKLPRPSSTLPFRTRRGILPDLALGVEQIKSIVTRPCSRKKQPEKFIFQDQEI